MPGTGQRHLGKVPPSWILNASTWRSKIAELLCKCFEFSLRDDFSCRIAISAGLGQQDRLLV